MIEEILLAGIGIIVGLIIGFLEGLRFWHKLDKDSYHIFYPVTGANPDAPMPGPCLWCESPPEAASPQEPPVV